MSADSEYRFLPSVEQLQRALGERCPLKPAVRVALSREAIAKARERIRAGSSFSQEALLDQVVAEAQRLAEPSLRRVINATGIVLHTNLGRAPLGTELFEAMRADLSGYCSLEVNTTTGVRGSRGGSIAKLCCLLWPAEAALVVNNAAAAVLLLAKEFAAGRSIAVSRGELVQIGGGFRVPDVLEASGARLAEVGTTNITTAEDYAVPEVAALLRVHRSNFVVSGHTERPSLAELGTVARRLSVPLLVDAGSAAPNVSDEAVDDDDPALALRAGATAVCFSGDKLLGGPQAGIILGTREAVARLRKNPLYRALRLGKLELYALEWTLRKWMHDEPLGSSLLRQSAATLRTRATRFAARLSERGVSTQVVDTLAPVGGGSLPEESLPSSLVAFDVRDREAFARALLSGHPPVFLRREGGGVAIDLRTVLPEDEEPLFERLLQETAAWRF